MATLPKFEQLGLDAPRPQTGAVSYRASSGMEEAPSEAATKFGETVQQIAFHQQDLLNTTRAEDAWNNYKSKALDLSVGNGGFSTLKGGNAVNGDIFKTYSSQLGDARKAIESGLGDDDVRRRFADRANVTDLQFKDSLLRHYTAERDVYEKQTFDGSMATAASMVAADPMNQQAFDTALLNTTRRGEALANHQGVTDQGSLDKMRNGVRDALISKRIDALVYSNPIKADEVFRLTEDQINNPELRLQLQSKTREAVMAVRPGIEAQKLIDQTRKEVEPKSRAAGGAENVEMGFNGAVDSLLKREGGYKAQDGNSGAPVNFGINQRANPDIDVAKLTKDQAKQIYKTRYWDAIGGDSLPQATAVVALDAAALQGPDVAKKLIFDTDGDPQAMIDIRRQQLTALAARDPSQAPNLPAWLKRLDGLQAQVTGMQNVAYHPDDPTAQNTSGLPNSRDLAAQLPMMEGKVDQRTNELYGNDPTNPDWQAFNKRMKAELHAKVNADVQQLSAIQRQIQGKFIDRILGGTTQQPAGAMTVGGQQPAGALLTSFSQVQADPALMRDWQLLDPGAKPAMLNLMARNVDRPGDPVLARQLFNRINLAPGDPRKIDFYQQITDPSISDRLSDQQLAHLRSEIDRDTTPGGRSMKQMRTAADSQVVNWFRTNLNSNVMFMDQKLTNPTAYLDWSNKWNDEVGKKIDDYIKARQPEKIRSMFMPDTPESVINPKYLHTFLGTQSTPAQALANQAERVKAGQQPTAQEPPVPQPATIDTHEKLDAWFQTLPPTATTFVGTDGKIRAIPPRSAAPAPAAGYGARADGTQKGEGFLGPQPTTIPGAPKDQVSTEISVGVNIGGKNVEIPTMVPTLTKPELDYLLAGGDPRTNNAIMDKAVAHAKDRLAAGKSPFAAPGEQVAPPAPAAAAAAPAAAVPITADAFEVTEKPTTVAGSIAALRKARERAMEIRKFGAQGPQYDVFGPATSVLRGVLAARENAVSAIRTGAAAAGEAIQAPIPTELEAVMNGFAAIKKSRKVTQADADIIEQSLRYGLLSPEDEALAKNLLVRLQGKK